MKRQSKFTVAIYNDFLSGTDSLLAGNSGEDDDIAANGTFNAFAVDLPPPRRSEIHFVYANSTEQHNVTVIGVVGRKTLLKCKVHNLGNKTVTGGSCCVRLRWVIFCDHSSADIMDPAQRLAHFDRRQLHVHVGPAVQGHAQPNGRRMHTRIAMDFSAGRGRL